MTLATTRLELERLHPQFVAEVRGVDLARPLDDAAFGRILDAFNEHAVLVFPGQDLDEERQIAFSERFVRVMRRTTVADDGPTVPEPQEPEEERR